MGKHVILEISSTELRLTPAPRARGASIVASIPPEDRDHSWERGLEPLETALRALVERAGCAGADAVVLATRPNGIVQARSTAGSGSAARDAALLALEDSASLVMGEDPMAATVVGRDQTGEPRRVHTLAAGDRAADAHTLVALVERCGLRVTALAPAEAMTLAALSAEALSVGASAGKKGVPVVVFRFDREHAGLAAMAQGRLLFTRSIGIGVRDLAEALTRSICGSAGEITLDEDEARALLEREGVPAFDREVDPARGIRGRDLLPLIQPILQRLVVEVKQSLRFGMEEPDRATARLRVTGVGADLPGLGAVIAEETGLTLEEPAPSKKKPGDWDAERARAAADLAQRLNLLPRGDVAVRVGRRMRVGLIAGLALAGLILVVDAGTSAWAAHALQGRIDTLRPIAAKLENAHVRYSAAVAALTTTRRSVSQIIALAPPRSHWDAFLAELSRRTPVTIRLDSVAGARHEDSADITIDGVAQAESAADARRAIAGFIESLRACPLVASVELGGVRRSGSDGGDQTFSAVVTIISTPRGPDALADAGLEGKP